MNFDILYKIYETVDVVKFLSKSLSITKKVPCGLWEILCLNFRGKCRVFVTESFVSELQGN